MNTGCGVIEAGPSAIRELCCDTAADRELSAEALDGIDDPVVLVDDRPMSIDTLWRAVLRSLDCADRDLFVVHPSWWSPARIAVVCAAAQTLSNHVVIRPRSWLLAQAAAEPRDAVVVVEIAERLVVVTHTERQAEPRREDSRRVAEAVLRVITSIRSGTVVVDAPSSVAGAGALARMIVDGLAATRGLTAVQVDDAMLRRLAARVVPDQKDCGRPAAPTSGARRRVLIVIVVLIATVLGLSAVDRRRAPTNTAMATTFLVEGHVAVQVPADWLIQRVTAGPGSARVQVTSPSDSQLALHVTQSPVGAETLAAAAEALKHAIDAEPPGVFVDFNPSGASAGRPALTYREVRAGHDIRWVVIVDKAVRIAIGCQSRAGQDDAVQDACQLAVRSARALD